MKSIIKEITKIDGNTTSYSINGNKANARIRVEQDADLVLKNLKYRKLGHPHDDMLLTTDRRFKLTKQTRIAFSSKMVSYSGKTTEKLVASTTKFSYRSSLLLKYSGVSTENLGNILELPKQKWHTEKSTINQIWLNYSGSGLCHVSNALENYGIIPNSPAPPAKPK